MTGESAPCPVPRARMKPQRPHVHRFRFESPEGFVSRGRCGCGAFRAAWADGMGPNGLSKRPGRETPVSVLRERNAEAWSAECEVLSAAAAVPSCEFREALCGPIWEQVATVLREADGKFVTSAAIAERVYGTANAWSKVAPVVSSLRARFGKHKIVSGGFGPGAAGYAWRGE